MSYDQTDPNRLISEKDRKMKRIIQDINRAYNAGAYRSAFALALTLPDICGQIEYPDIAGCGDRYSKWIDNYLMDDENSGRIYFTVQKGEVEDGVFQVDGETYFRLRCTYLHSGSADLEDEKKDYPDFEFILLSEEDKGIYARTKIDDGVRNRLMVDIRGEIKTLVHSALEYYKKNKEKFGNFVFIRDLEREDIIRKKQHI